MVNAPLNDPGFVSRGLNLGLLYHVGIAVRDLDAALKRYGEAFGIREWRGRDPEPPPADLAHGGPPHGTLRWAYTNTQFPWLEFIQPADDVDWAVPQFLRRHGEGVHHLGYFVDDVDEAMRQAERLGIGGQAPGAPAGQPDPQPRRVVYLDASTTHGVSIELVSVKLRPTLVNFVQTGVWTPPA